MVVMVLLPSSKSKQDESNFRAPNRHPLPFRSIYTSSSPTTTLDSLTALPATSSRLVSPMDQSAYDVKAWQTVSFSFPPSPSSTSSDATPSFLFVPTVLREPRLRLCYSRFLRLLRLLSSSSCRRPGSCSVVEFSRLGELDLSFLSFHHPPSLVLSTPPSAIPTRILYTDYPPSSFYLLPSPSSLSLQYASQSAPIINPWDEVPQQQLQQQPYGVLPPQEEYSEKDTKTEPEGGKIKGKRTTVIRKGGGKMWDE